MFLPMLLDVSSNATKLFLLCYCFFFSNTTRCFFLSPARNTTKQNYQTPHITLHVCLINSAKLTWGHQKADTDRCQHIQPCTPHRWKQWLKTCCPKFLPVYTSWLSVHICNSLLYTNSVAVVISTGNILHMQSQYMKTKCSS